MDRMTYNVGQYPYNERQGYMDEFNGDDQYAINNASFSDYNAPEHLSQEDQFYQTRPAYNYRTSSRNASEVSNGYSGMPNQNFNRGFVGHPNDVMSNLSDDVNPLDEKFSDHSFTPSGRNLAMVSQRPVSRNSYRQPYVEPDVHDSWAPQQNSFNTNDQLNNSYRPQQQQSILNKSHSNSQFAFGSDSKLRKPDLSEVIDFLGHQSDAVKANAAAYLQHISYMDDNVKVQTRVLRGIPPLLNLINHSQPEVHRAACGALRNLSYGRANDDNKREIKDHDGITTLVRLIRRNPDQEVLELVTGIIWNLSSCAELKKQIIDEGLKTLLDRVIVPLSRDGQNSIPGYRSVIFRNASGVLRNVSSDGEYARKKMRECEGLIGSLIRVIQQSLANEDCDNKSIENCVCVLRNLSYACQEVSDPDYLRKKVLSLDDKDSKTGCFGNKSKSTSKQKNSSIALAPIFDHSKQANSTEMSQLWSSNILDIYLPLLNYCTNPDTLEATAGAIQNLVACDWQHSKDLREAMRKRKGIDVIIRLINDSPDKVVCASARSLRNLALDDKCRDLIGKHAMRNLVEKLPASSDPSNLGLSTDTLLAIQSTLYEVIKANSGFARVFVDNRGVNRLMNISKSRPGVFDDRVVKYSRQLLQKIWKYGDLHDELKKNGFEPNDFVFTNSTTVGRSSAENTINRPIMSQGRSQFDSSFRRPANQNNGDLYNQNSFVPGGASYSLSRREDELPLDALHAMQISDAYRDSRENFNRNNNLRNSFASGLNAYNQSQASFQGDPRTSDLYGMSYSQDVGRFDQSQAAYTGDARDQGPYWLPANSNPGTLRSSNNMVTQESTDRFHPRPQPRNLQLNDDSWV